MYLLLRPKRGMFSGVLLVGRSHFVGVSRDSGMILAVSSSGRTPRDVEGAAGEGASLASTNGPPLHHLQQIPAALAEARSR